MLRLHRWLPPKQLHSQDTIVESTPPTTLPYLPSEIWLLIIRYATSSTYPFHDSSPAVSFLSLSHSHCYLQHRLAHYRATMRRKALMTLVSKFWHNLVQEILFEFVWISRASEARQLASLLSSQSTYDSSGKFIQRLHIETPSLERCNPIDLRTILDHAPRLIIYSDYRSVRRRNFHEQKSHPGSSPEQLLSALVHPNNSLRRLSWTSYEDVSFHLHFSPLLESNLVENLEFLELNFCSSHLHSMSSSSFSPSPSATTITTLTLPALRSLKVTLDNATFTVLSTWSLPALTNLSVLSADFSYLSTGFTQFFKVHGPKLLQLELGHSSAIIEEHYLTSSSSGILLQHGQQHQDHPGQTQIPPLASLCPNLVEFICSADAEWNWQHPDWIAPHILLPSHPTLQFIGIRDIEKRLREDVDLLDDVDDHDRPFFVLLEQVGSLLRREAFPALLFIRDLSWESDLLRRGVEEAWGRGVVGNGGAGAGAGSGGAGAGVEGGNGNGSVGASVRGLVRGLKRFVRNLKQRHSSTGLEHDEQEHPPPPPLSPETLRVLTFWACVLERCREGGVWLEDFRGVNVTMRDLRRVREGCVR